MVGWLTEEEIRHKDLILVVFVIGVSKDVGALYNVNGWKERMFSRYRTDLKGLWAKAEDIIDNQDGRGGRRRTGLVFGKASMALLM